MESDKTKKPQIQHSLPTNPTERVKVYVGQGVSGETLAQYLVENGLAHYVDEPKK